MLAGPGVDRVLDLEEMPPLDLGRFDHIECMSVLEHSRRPWLLADSIERLLVPGGTLFVTVPFCWRIHAYPSDYWRMTPQAIRELFPGVHWDALMLANETLSDKARIPGVDVNGHVYMSKTETVGFGRR
jgi:SAM-dependent methyltransferase